MQLTIIGTGFVGVVSSAVFASHGNRVIGLDIDPAKVEKLKHGVVPFYEPGLTELLLEQQKQGTLHFTTDYAEAIRNAEVIMIAVGTPSQQDGQVDLKYIFSAVDSLAPHLKEGAIVAIKSTVPPGTLKDVAEHIRRFTQVSFFTASLPEFLKEGTAVHDTLHPDRIVIGATDKTVFEKLTKLHEPFKAPIITISPESAQMAKYSANAYLALRITFINQIADLCQKNGANVQEVIEAIGHDKRIGSHYWYPGLGYGGSCFPKDVRELSAYSRHIGENENLLNKMNTLNEERIPRLMSQYAELIGGWENKRVAVLGISFKPHTDDTREAPSLRVIPYLTARGAEVVGYDPKAMCEFPHFVQAKSLPETIKDADVIISLIEWPEIVKFDFAPYMNKNKKQWFIDTRNQFSPEKITKLGFHYVGVGR